jgi:AspT/YidE/YbjL antiporter-like protein
MGWLFDLVTSNPTAHAIAILSLVCVGGMLLGSVQFRGIKLGTAGVLFAALITGHFSKPVDHHTLEFVKEFGLILFVFCIGLQIGPGFLVSIRRSGLKLNALALAIVVLGALAVVALGWLLKFDGAAVLGLFSGATTNTPSLGAAQQTLASFPGISPERAALPALAYAVSYPMGIVGIIGTLVALRAMFHIDVASELAAHAAAAQIADQPVDLIEPQTCVVENPILALFVGIFLGIALGTLPIAIPGLPQPLRLGLAGGPLVVAIFVGARGHIGRLVWHMPKSANVAFREFGIALFFAGVGLMAGPTFFATAFSRTGLLWLVAGAFVTIIPILAVGIFARTQLGLNYVDLAGLLAGSMTDPPALAFANGLCQSEAPAVAYATVYPLTMLLRILTAQFLAVVLCGS